MGQARDYSARISRCRKKSGTFSATQGNQHSSCGQPPRRQDAGVTQERTMRVKQQLVWATAVAAAGLVAACSGAPEGPTAPSAVGSPAGSALTEAQTAAVTAECRFGSGNVVINPGAPPPAGPPGTPGTPPTSGTSPGGPAGPPPPGTQVALGGVLEARDGACPAVTLTISGKTVRTGSTTSFGSGSCSSLKIGDQVGAMGETQGDGSIIASCVAAGS
jgi:hypothetical protein